MFVKYCKYFVGFILFILSNSNHAQSNNQGIDITANIVNYWYSLDGDEVSNTTLRATISLNKDGRYTLRVDSDPDKGVEIIVGYDGEDLYTVLYSDEVLDMRGEVMQSNRSRESSMHPAIVSKGPYPLHYTWNYTIPWYVYLNGRYDGIVSESQTPAPWLDARRQERAWCFQEKVTRLEEFPYLPKMSEFIFKKEFIQKNREELSVVNGFNTMNSRREEIAILENSQDGFKEAEFITKEHIDISGFRIPKLWEMKIYYSVEYDMEGKGKLMYLIRGETTTVEESGVKENYKPSISGILAVSDDRFRYRNNKYENEFMTYRITDRSWKSRSQVEAMPNYEAYKYNPKVTYNNKYSTIIKLLIGGGVLIIIITVIKEFKKSL
jgi:hypothetical protein